MRQPLEFCPSDYSSAFNRSPFSSSGVMLPPLLGALLSAPPPADAQETGRALTEAFSAWELRTGKSASTEECSAQRHAVWISHESGSECIRYYPSGGLDRETNTARMAVLFFHGDHLAGSTPIGNYEKLSPDSLTKVMQNNYRKFGVPYILVARPGVYGSSGDHSQRRRAREFHSMNAAVDALKQRYGLERVILAGQSGGSTVGSALLTLGRRDVACAVLGSGNYDLLALAEIKRAKAGLKSSPDCDVTNYCDPYNVIDHVSGIAADPLRLIAIVGDPADNNTAFPLQQKFADALRAAGHAVELIETEGKGPDRHGVSSTTFRLAGACAAWIAAGTSGTALQLASAARGVSHAYKTPPASGFARIDDIAAVPLGAAGQLRYAHFLTLSTPRAFVLTERSGWYFSAGNEDAMQQALDYCPRNTKCWLYAVDDQVVWAAAREARIATLEPIDLPAPPR